MQFDWNSEKNTILKEERGISFETVILHIARGDIWKIADHPNQRDYPGQKLLYVIVSGYIHIVPYVRESDLLFLKTIIPSRKATRDYHAEEKDN